METKASGISIPSSDNQFATMDFNSYLTDPEKITDTQIKANKLFSLIKNYNYAPTHTPSNFNDQFATYNGSLYVYVNGAWKSLSGGSYYMGHSTTNTTGSQSITGVGFQPKMIRITAVMDLDDYGFSVGVADGSRVYCMTLQLNAGALNYDTYENYLVNVRNSAGAVQGWGQFTQFDADGFTIYWQTVSATVKFMYECYG